MPSYREVIYKFFSTYATETPMPIRFFKRKRKVGLLQKDPIRNLAVFPIPIFFWSVKGGGYQPLSYSSTSTDTSIINQSIKKLLAISWR
jgi:hypothetical protein